MPKPQTAAPVAEETPADAVQDAPAPVEGSAGPQDGAEAAAPVEAPAVTEPAPEGATQVAAETKTVTEGPAEDAAAVDRLVDDLRPVIQEQPELIEKIDPAFRAAFDENPPQPVHVPSLLRIWVAQIEGRNTGWERGDLCEQLRAAGMEMPSHIERGVDATISLGGVSVTSHLGEEFILNYWAAQARQALLGRAE